MKAILVVDIPDDVEIEDCEIEYSVKEQVMLTQVAKGKTKLKPMPNRIDWLENGYSGGWVMFSTGWNACVGELEK